MKKMTSKSRMEFNSTKLVPVCGLDVFSFFLSFCFFFVIRGACAVLEDRNASVRCELTVGLFVIVGVYFWMWVETKNKKCNVADNVDVDVGSRSMGCWISAEYFTSAPMYFVLAPPKI